MAKIIRMFNEQEKEQQALVNHIEDLLQAAKKGDIHSILIVAKRNDGEIMTGYCNLDAVEKQYLLSHAQVDVNYQVVEANVDNLIEIINS